MTHFLHYITDLKFTYISKIGFDTFSEIHFCLAIQYPAQSVTVNIYFQY